MQRYGISSFLALLLILATLFSLTACGDTLPADADVDRMPTAEYTDGQTTLIKTYKDNRYVAVTYFVTENGAKGDGITDDTAAIQATLDKAAKTGGRVYIPAGKYRLTSQINIPDGVTLIGDFAPPTLKGAASEAGTLLICAETTSTLRDPLIKLNDNSAISDLTVWYEGQKYDSVKEYPYTVIQDDGESASVSNLALLNSYNGINFNSPRGKKLTVENIYITAFGTGFNIVRCTDRVILENINLSPIYWINSSLTEKSKDFSSDLITDRMYESLCAIRIGAVSDASIYGVKIDTAKDGIVFDIPSAMDGSAVASQLSVTNASNAVTITSAGRYGIAFASCTFRTTDLLGSCAVKTEKGFTTSAVFNSCSFPGQPYQTVASEGSGKLSFVNCKFTAWRTYALTVEDGLLASAFNSYLSENPIGLFTVPAVGVFCNDSTTPDNYAEGDVFMTESENEYSEMSIDSSWLSTSDSIPDVKDKIYYASAHGITPQNADNTETLQDLIDTVSKDGGGIIFLTEGEYRVNGNLDLKANVRLCGVSDKATTLLTPMAFTDKIFITMGDGSSLFDLGIAFVGDPVSTATDRDQELIPTSYAVSTQKGAKNIHIEGVSLQNLPNGVNLDAADSPTVKKVTGSAFLYGVYLKDCASPLLKSVTFDTTYATEAAKTYQQEHFVGFAVNGGKDIKILNCYVDNADYGVLVNSGDALESDEPMIVVNALLSKNCYAGFCIEKSTTSVFVNNIAYCAVFDKNAYHGSTLSTSRGRTYVYNMICGGKATASLIVRGDSEVFVQTSIFNGDLANTVRMLGGYVEAVGNVMAADPTLYHLHADNGTSIFMGNLVTTDITYGGVEKKYLTKSVSDSVIFVDHYNIRPFGVTGDRDY